MLPPPSQGVASSDPAAVVAVGRDDRLVVARGVAVLFERPPLPVAAGFAAADACAVVGRVPLAGALALPVDRRPLVGGSGTVETAGFAAVEREPEARAAEALGVDGLPLEALGVEGFRVERSGVDGFVVEGFAVAVFGAVAGLVAVPALAAVRALVAVVAVRVVALEGRGAAGVPAVAGFGRLREPGGRPRRRETVGVALDASAELPDDEPDGRIGVRTWVA